MLQLLHHIIVINLRCNIRDDILGESSQFGWPPKKKFPGYLKNAF
jgi:hypothetical protein